MYKVGLIGTGYWGSKIRAELQQHPQVSTLVSTNQRSSDHHIVLSDPEISHVFIATPLHTHFDLTLAALKQGKHVMCEKNFTPTLREARVLVDYAAVQQKTLLVDFIYTFNPALDQIEIGPEGVSIEFWQHGRFRAEGVMSMLGSHGLAVAGTVLNLEGAELSHKEMTYPTGKNFESHAVCVWRLPSGQSVWIGANINAPEGTKIRTLELNSSPWTKYSLDYPLGIRLMIDRFFRGEGNGDLAIQVARCLDQLNHRW